MTTISSSTTLTTAYVCSPDTTGTLVLQTGATPTTAVTIDSSQNVGIGTSSPVTNLTISSASAATGGDGLQNVHVVYTGTGTANAGYTAKNYYGTSQFFQWNNNGTRLGNRVITNAGGGNLVLTYGNDSEGARIDSSGNLLVGTATQATGALLTVNGSIKGVITSGTAVASTSGTAIDFTGIPSWAKKITVMFYNFSTNGSSSYLVQLGAGSVTTSGYGSVSNGSGGTNSTAGMVMFGDGAANSHMGQMIISNVTGNLWVSSHNLIRNNGTNTYFTGAGGVTLGGTLDRVRITTVNGTDTFDLGTVNIQYEG